MSKKMIKSIQSLIVYPYQLFNIFSFHVLHLQLNELIHIVDWN